MNQYKTKGGTILPLISLKGKPYMQVAHRLVWFTEETPRFNVTTEFVVLSDEQTVAKAVIEVFDESGQLIRKACASKRETKKDFSDHTEKAETGAIGRALVELGFGTQFAIADLDEGERLADSPIDIPKKAKETEVKFTSNGAPKTDFQTPAQPSTTEIDEAILVQKSATPESFAESAIAGKPKLSSFKRKTAGSGTNGASSGGWE